MVGAGRVGPRRSPPKAGPRWVRVALTAAAAAAVSAGCARAQPDVTSLAAEPVLSTFPDGVQLASLTQQPRRSGVGVASRDGVVERVVAVDLLPAAAADLVQQRHDSRYGFRRVDLGVGTPVSVELRGASPTGAQVIVTATSGRAVPLYASLDDVQTPPADRPTAVVISVVSRP